MFVHRSKRVSEHAYMDAAVDVCNVRKYTTIHTYTSDTILQSIIDNIIEICFFLLNFVPVQTHFYPSKTTFNTSLCDASLYQFILHG